MSDSEHDDQIANEPDCNGDVITPAEPERNRRPGPVSTFGKWVLCILLCSSNGLWVNIRLPSSLAELTPYESGHVLGIALTRWEFIGTAECKSQVPSWLFSAEYTRSRQARQHFGFLIYRCKHIAKLHAPVSISQSMSNTELIDSIRRCLAYNYDLAGQFWHRPVIVDRIVAEWSEPFSQALRVASKAFSPTYLTAFFRIQLYCICVVLLLDWREVD